MRCLRVGGNVSCGSKADIRAAKSHVRFTPRKRTFISASGLSAQQKSSARLRSSGPQKERPPKPAAV
jgi:hypothetical protein